MRDALGMIVPTAPAWLDEVAAHAQRRLDELDAALESAASALGAAVHTTDWHAPSARAFHEKAFRRRGDVVGARDRVAGVAELVRRVRAGLGAEGVGR